MATAVTLEQAANEADENMYPFWQDATLKARLENFGTTSLALFPEQDVNSHPVSNWLTLVLWAADQLSASPTVATIAQYEQAMQFVYRCCFMGQQLLTQALITAPQAAAMLASYNLQF